MRGNWKYGHDNAKCAAVVIAACVLGIGMILMWAAFA